ncbi:MAG: BMP family ABC transporter substrate-binding protein [Anaerolineae bacterium]|jgi:basic membrane protein A and related proteins|nr:BMP family ABC transporter substrate-binding protein [Anaerolineae bacterium]MBT7075842.1 BMP family ABC transporter substrate-binding protein [Anaerolineae bacterium]MBT7782430.1 BMP family ABC transporter substrate-binding protein [Anaerolineae bacterium]
MNKKILWFLSVLIIASFVLTACGGTDAPAPAEEAAVVDCKASADSDEEGSYQIPTIIEGCYNVGFVYVGPHDDGGWTQAHDVGREWVEENVPEAHTAYVEIVAEGADAEQVIRSLARKGFDVIFTTSFGYMDASEIVAEEFPDVDIIHISGFKSNEANFGNLMGAMEDMKYLAGMLAGSRAKMDGGDKLGYIATFPIPEELRLGNAFALGAAKTCPECTIDVRWIFTWHDPILEKEAAASLFDAGASVVMTGADTPAPAEVAPEGKYGITYDYSGNCVVDACLTSMYWNWGPVYGRIVEESMAGTWVGGWEYFDADSGAMGLLGFMEGEEMMPGVVDLPAEDLALINDTMAAMLAGEFTRFDVFAGPITDNQGNEILAEGEVLEQLDLDGFAQFGVPCETCMYWWNENITAELPSLD